MEENKNVDLKNESSDENLGKKNKEDPDLVEYS